MANCDFDRSLIERVGSGLSSFRRFASDLGRGSPTVGEESRPEPLDEDAVSSSMDWAFRLRERGMGLIRDFDFDLTMYVETAGCVGEMGSGEIG